MVHYFELYYGSKAKGSRLSRYDLTIISDCDVPVAFIYIVGFD